MSDIVDRRILVGIEIVLNMLLHLMFRKCGCGRCVQLRKRARETFGNLIDDKGLELAD